MWNSGFAFNNVTVANEGGEAIGGWNGGLQPGTSAVYGFQGNHNGNFQPPVCTAD